MDSCIIRNVLMTLKNYKKTSLKFAEKAINFTLISCSLFSLMLRGYHKLSNNLGILRFI